MAQTETRASTPFRRQSTTSSRCDGVGKFGIDSRSSFLPWWLSAVVGLQHNALAVLSRAFIASRNNEDKKQRERVEREAAVAFDMILDVIASVHMLEPFEPSQVRRKYDGGGGYYCGRATIKFFSRDFPLWGLRVCKIGRPLCHLLPAE